MRSGRRATVSSPSNTRSSKRSLEVRYETYDTRQAIQPPPPASSHLLPHHHHPYASSGIDESLVTPEAIHQLEIRAQQASPREQCFLYTELVHSMTELAGKEMLAGDTDQATATLKRVDHYAHLIHVALAANDKRLKNAEMLMHHTIQRLVRLHARSLRR